MKVTRTVLITLAVLLILVNLLPYLSGSAPAIPKDETVNKIAYLIGFHMFLILGIILLLVAHILGRKIKARANKEMVDSLLKGNNTD